MYYKVTNKKENHHGFQYVDGLNILIEPFSPTGSCVPGGFYFTTKEHIHKFYNYGINLRLVTLPESDPDFQMVKDPSGDKWRANKIILGKKYSLFDPVTYQELNLDITANKFFIDYACRDGCIDVLNWWTDCSLVPAFDYSHGAINWASANGHSNVLEWWLKSNLELRYTRDAITWASTNGHSDVLEWWKKSGLKLMYNTDAIYYASCMCHVNALDWWKNSGLELKYNHNAIISAINHGHINILEWWKNSGLELKYTDTVIVWPKNNLVREWLKENKFDKNLNIFSIKSVPIH